MAWTHVVNPDDIARHLPAWLGRHMIGVRGAFGVLLSNGDVMRLTSIAAAHCASDGTILLDVLLDSAGVPDGVDLAWRSKHFLGAPVPGASLATVNLAHVVAAVEFTVPEFAEPPGEETVPLPDSLVPEPAESQPITAGRPSVV
jgi:hypothetical protein